MKSLKRLLKYVWPQWPRVIVVVVSAVFVAIFLSLSFMTVIPLLKVMMGEEGLHGWVDRKVSGHRYGVSFYVPGKIDFMSKQDMAHYLLVTGVDYSGPAQKCGLRENDRIVGVGEYVVGAEFKQHQALTLLTELAHAEGHNDVAIQILRADSSGSDQAGDLVLVSGRRPVFLNTLESLLSHVPREQSQEDKTRAVTFIILGVGVITVIRCTAKFTQEYMSQKIVHLATAQIREETFGHVMRLPLGYFANERPSDSVSRIMRDTSAMQKAIRLILGKALREPLNTAFLLAGAFWLEWKLTLLFLCSAPLVLGMVAIFGKKMRKATRKSLVAGSEMLAKLQEVMNSLRVVKAYNHYEYESDRFRITNNRLVRQLLKMSKVTALTQPVMEILGMAAGSLALVVGAHWVSSGDMDGTEFLGLLILLGCAAEAARKTGDIWPKLQEAEAAAERVFGLLDTEKEYEADGAVELGALRDRLEFKDVVFTYPTAPEETLRGIDLTIKAGSTVAVVGGNGSGKTTMMNLIPRFYNPDRGSILIDGVDIKDASLHSVRGQIGMVTQNVVTFNDTVRANIAYGNESATDEEIVSAAKRAYVHEFVEPLPKGYDTVIGEQGSGFSGGQLQRIVIARAIAKNPPILIFDEATSQVDADSEAKIHKAIEKIMHGRTSFIIAHRFSTVVSADKIVVMDKGMIVAQGRHSELMESCALYQSLYRTQLVKA